MKYTYIIANLVASFILLKETESFALKNTNGNRVQISKLHSSVSTQQPLPPAITVDGVTCSHDGGTTYQLKDVSYVLPKGKKRISRKN